MKKIFIVLVVLFTTVSAYSTTFPVIEPFNGPVINNSWEQFWSMSATLESVQASGEPCGDSPLGDGFIGKSTCIATTFGSSGHVAGEDTDSDYTIQAYVYTPVVNTDTGPEAYWYQQLIFYRTGPTGAGATSYGRFHTHFNNFGGTIPAPRIRVTTGGTVMTWNAPDFTVPSTSSWHKMKMEITGTTALCYFDGAQLPGTLDWTSTAPGVNAGRFGIAQYMDDVGTLSIYVDMFKVWKGSEPPDPTPTPTPEPPAAAQNWMYFE